MVEKFVVAFQRNDMCLVVPPYVGRGKCHPESGDEGVRVTLVSLKSFNSCWLSGSGWSASITGSTAEICSSVPITPITSPGRCVYLPWYGITFRAALNHDQADAVALADVGVYEPFAYEGASVAHADMGEVEVVDEVVVFTRTAPFAFVEVFDEFCLYVAQAPVQAARKRA